jgi:hypothetical protein
MLEVDTVVSRIATLSAIPAHRPSRKFWILLGTGAVLLLLSNYVLVPAAPAAIVVSPPDVTAAPDPSTVIELPASPALWIRVSSGTSPPVAFAIMVSSFCLFVSALMLVVLLPIYLFSQDTDRIPQGGGLVKTTLGFIVTAGGGVIGTLSFR